MFGVVLWSDSEENKAVIWCEDHGDLAFYRRGEDGQDVMLDAGDLVQFDLTMDRHLRLAQNPRLVSEGVCTDLADALTANDAAAPVLPRQSADIIPFRPAGEQNSPRQRTTAALGA